jgi:hypothetical protein
VKPSENTNYHKMSVSLPLRDADTAHHNHRAAGSRLTDIQTSKRGEVVKRNCNRTESVAYPITDLNRNNTLAYSQMSTAN